MKTPNNRIGLIWPSDGVLDSELWQFAPAHASLHFTRTQVIDEPISLSLVERMAEDTDIDYGAETLRPISPAVVTYACTSGSLVIGEKRVFAELNRGAPAAKATSLITGVIRALHAVGARRIVVVTPYLDEVNRREVDYLEDAGFEVLSMCGLNLEKDSDMVRVAPDYIAEFALGRDCADADAIFVSCGALRTLDVIGEIEARAGKPAICSNQAMIWDCLRLAGIEDRFDGYGRLLSQY